MMDRQLSHMVRLIDDLLDVSRISRTRWSCAAPRVLLADVVSSAVETARPAIEAAGHELTVSLPPEPVHLDADLTRLAQVFGNLLNNSAKYTERGGQIWLTAEREGGEVVVAVRDTGIGIPAEALPNIFDMFSQVDRSIERSTGGLGIGLALVKGLVEMHGGTVDGGERGPGQGQHVHRPLPVLADQAEPSPQTLGRRTPDSAGPKRRILVVDDNRDAADSHGHDAPAAGQRGPHRARRGRGGGGGRSSSARGDPDGRRHAAGSTATRRPGASASSRGDADMTIIALTGWGQEADRSGRRRPGATATWSSRSACPTWRSSWLRSRAVPTRVIPARVIL